jgi:hypothetical protein
MTSMRWRLLVVGLAGSFYVFHAAAMQSPPPPLGTAASFAVLGGSSVVNSGGTRVSGNVGVSPGKSISGITRDNFVVGDIFVDDAIARQAQRDGADTYAKLAARSPCTPLTPNPAPGVYCVTSPLPKTLTLRGDATSVWIFQAKGSLATLDDSSVLLSGGAMYCNVFWQVDGSVTLGARSAFVGTILARADITLKRDVSVSGRLLSQTGVVTLDTDDISCCDPIEFTPASLPKPKAGEPYNQTITLTGGVPPYTVSLFDGTLPPWLTLAANGRLSGTPTASDDSTFTVLAVDARGCSSIHTYAITVCGPLTVTFDVEPKPKTCEIFWRKIVTSGGTLAVKGLPANGLLLDGVTITGMPLAPICIAITIEVTDACGQVSLPVQLCTDCGPLPLPPLNPPAATACVRYIADVTPSCGKPPFVYTPILSPPWLSGPINGIVSGIPPAGGTESFVVNVTDANGCTGTRTYTLDVGPVFPPAPSDPIDSKGSLCMPYDSGPLPGVLIEPATLPPGLIFVNSSLRGIPTQSGKFCFKRTVPNAPACTSAVQEYCVTIECPTPLLEPLKPLQACLPANQRLTPDFCVPFTCVVTGTLPAGMAVDDCTLHGNPQFGDYDFCVTAAAAGCSASTRCYSGTVVPLQLTPPAGLLPAATVGVGFSQTFTASGAPGPFTYLIGAPEIPPGLTFNQSTGKLSGIPTTTGRYNFAVYAFDAGGACTSVVYTLDVGPVGPMPMGIPALSGWAMVILSIVLVAVAIIRRPA